MRIRPLAGVAAAALAVAALGGCENSSGGASAGSFVPTSPVVGASSGPSSVSASSSVSAGPSAAPSGHSMTAITPLRPLTCASVPASLGTFRSGGRLPSGVPLPQAVPTLTCAGRNGSVAVVWSTISQAQYRQEIVQTGWQAHGPIFTKAHAAQAIRLSTVQGDLVAVYRPR